MAILLYRLSYHTEGRADLLTDLNRAWLDDERQSPLARLRGDGHIRRAANRWRFVAFNGVHWRVWARLIPRPPVVSGA